MEEYIDILDERGNKTGEKRTRAEVHRRGLWHRTVHCWILNGRGELLLQKRGKKLTHPGQWDISAAGHIQAGQSSIEAAMEETREELGLDLSPDDFQYLFTGRTRTVHNNGTFINNERQDVYLINLDIDIKDLRCNDEVMAVEFVAWPELERLVERGEHNLVAHPEEYKRLFAIISRR